MADLNQLFVIKAIARYVIADELNEYLDLTANKERLAPDDDRLTDEICRKYAAGLAELDGSDAADDLQQELVYDILTNDLHFAI